MPFPYIDETKELTNSLRQSVEGSFVALPDGYTHYELRGKNNAETVVFVHGFSVPYFIWEPTFRFLLKAGYRVLRYDLFGRGYSDRPKAAYNLDFFANQLHDLLDALKITEAINLFGLSMGGPITATFTVRHPERVKRLALFAPAGGETIPLSFAYKALLIPGIGELLMGLLGKKTLIDGIAEDFYDPELIAHFQNLYTPQLSIHGFGRAILSTMQNDALGDSSAIYKRVGEMKIPTLLIWGREDKTVPYDQAEIVVSSLKHARFHTIKNSGHIPHYENADEVNPIILDFLQ
jgi:pimeloyl-ACP methyl ester carboxylesterase